MTVDELTGYCPKEDWAKRTFRRVGNGIAVIGSYECGCTYREYQLGIGDLQTRIKEKLTN